MKQAILQPLQQAVQMLIESAQLPLVTFFFFIIVLSLLRSAWFKGRFGEWWVNRLLTRHLDPERYHLIKDVTLTTDDGTTQIDHIVLSEFGIFVIETKNMKGWIFGSEKQKMWTQKIFRYTGQFQNPLRQNYKHTQTLIEKLDLVKEHVHSLVVFVGDSEFKTDMPENVTYPRGMIDFILSKQEVIGTAEEVQYLSDAIATIRLKPGLKTDREHVKHLTEKHGNR